MRFLARPELVVLLACSTAVFVHAQESQSAPLAMQRLAPGTRLIRTVVVDGRIVSEDRGGGAVDNAPAAASLLMPQASAGGEERLIYSNTLGRVAVDFGANRLISDDVTITSTGRNGAEVTCRLRRMAFQVDGRVSEAPGSASGPYSITWALYNTCPYAVTAGAQRNSRIIPGSAGNLEINDDAPRWIEVEFPAEMPVYAWTHMWLALHFSRGNAGAVMGAPAMEGFSSDVIDFPGAACSASLGGFPTHPHASMNLQIWGETKTCPQAYVAYRSLNEAGLVANSGVPSEWLTDDITLQNPCVALGFTFGIRGPGVYAAQLRPNCSSFPIAGFTYKWVAGPSSGYEPRPFEVLLPNPINIAQNFSYAISVNNTSGGAIVAGREPAIGQTADSFESTPECEPVNVHELLHEALHFSLICAGPAPLGACCDMYLTQCKGGSYDGQPCSESADCSSPGICESVCREVPQSNCPPSAPNTDHLPAWEEGKTCASDPDPEGAFPDHLCGQAACCAPNQACVDVTKAECEALSHSPWQWQRGRFCDEQEYCWLAPCLGSHGDCKVEHFEPGCEDPWCCAWVCASDPYCCAIDWDSMCVLRAEKTCCPQNDCQTCKDDFCAFDADISCTIDLRDFAAFQRCFDPSGAGLIGCCDRMQAFPKSFDRVIDLLDYQYMWNHFE